MENVPLTKGCSSFPLYPSRFSAVLYRIGSRLYYLTNKYSAALSNRGCWSQHAKAAEVTVKIWQLVCSEVTETQEKNSLKPHGVQRSSPSLSCASAAVISDVLFRLNLDLAYKQITSDMKIFNIQVSSLNSPYFHMSHASLNCTVPSVRLSSEWQRARQVSSQP